VGSARRLTGCGASVPAMSDDLDGVVTRALHDATLELSLEFHAGPGGKTGAVGIRDASGETIARVAVGSAEELNLVLARLVVRGFSAANPGPRLEAAPPSPPRRSRIETSVLVAGVDGYRKGWVAVSLDPSGDVEVSTHADFTEVLSLRAEVIAVDIPIDPAGLGSRPTDAAARAFVGPGRASAVFPTPPREALQARTFTDACDVARRITGKAISQQAFALGRKILEVHEHAAADERVIEMHPEVSFCQLAGTQLLESKHTPEGLDRRRALLEEAGIRLPGAVPGVPEADLLDAAVGAWTAARYASGKAAAFPPTHTERLGAIWR
jgi:predicted RNase H-like nuclease